jgi:hypothetical protein
MPAYSRHSRVPPPSPTILLVCLELHDHVLPRRNAVVGHVPNVRADVQGLPVGHRDHAAETADLCVDPRLPASGPEVDCSFQRILLADGVKALAVEARSEGSRDRSAIAGDEVRAAVPGRVDHVGTVFLTVPDRLGTLRCKGLDRVPELSVRATPGQE